MDGRRISPDWEPYVRDDDGELLGYLVPEDGRVVPVTVFGCALGPAGSEDEAIALLRERGLTSLAEPWWLARGGPDDVVEVRILSAYGDRIEVVETEYGFFGPDSTRHRVAVPDTEGRLRPTR